MCELSVSKIIIISGLLFSMIGSGILVWRPAKMYLTSLFSREAKCAIENESIAVPFNRFGGDRDKMLDDGIVKGYLATYRSSLWGFFFLLLGFFLQLIGTLVQ